VELLVGNHQPISLTPFEQVIYVGHLRARRCDLAQYAFLECRKFSWELTSGRGMIEKVQIIRQELYF
jgi:hypothetical protein